jgi:hypothetical protein
MRKALVLQHIAGHGTVRITMRYIALFGSLTIVASTIGIVRLTPSSSRYAMFPRTESIHNKRNHF